MSASAETLKKIAATDPGRGTTLRFTLEAGLLLRGALRSALRKAQFEFDGDLTFEEDKRWLSSTFFITYEGTAAGANVIREWADRLVEAGS